MIQILIVDDEKIERNGIKFLLKQLHMEAEIREAVNGVKALEALEEKPVDILLTDIKMPFMDGLELAENVMKKYPQTKMVIFSGYGEFEYAKKAMSYGVKYYLLKPCNEEQILESVQGVVRDCQELMDSQELTQNQFTVLSNLQHHVLFSMINDYVYPVIHLNQDYVQMMQNQPDEETRIYLNEKIHQAEELQENIGRRNETMLKLTKCILEVQEQFFKNGKKPLVPFTISEAAARMNVSISTVSRAANEKYLQCCWGTFPFSAFFSKGVMQDGERQISVDAIKEAIRMLIESEDKRKPYSDQKLEELLKERKILISRRAIAKYREELGIPSTRGRKSYAS